MSKKPVSAATLNTYTKKEMVGYLTGLAGQNIIYNIIATGLAFYFQSVIFLPAIACSLIFALARVWDAINDPMMGTIVDKTRTKWGKCKPYLLFVPVVILVTTILPFLNKMYAEPNRFYNVMLIDDMKLVELDKYVVPEDESTFFGKVTVDGKNYVLATDGEESPSVMILEESAEGLVPMTVPENASDKDIENAQKVIVDAYLDETYGNFTPSADAAYGKIDFEGKTYYVIPMEEESQQVLLYEEAKDGALIRVETAADATEEEISEKAGLRATAIEEFKNKYGFEKQSGVSAVLIIAWAAFSYVLWGMTYTIGDIPLWGVTSLMTEDQNDRAKILSLARAVANVGMIGTFFTMIAPAFQGMFKERGMDEAHSLRMAYITLAVVMTLFATILFQFAGFSVKERVAPQNKKTYTIKENFQIMFGNKPFRQILISGILRSPIQLLSIVAMTLVMYYFFNNDIGSTLVTDDGLNVALILKVVILVIGLFGGMIVFPLFVPKLITKIEKKTLYNFFTLIGAIPFALIFVFFKLSGGNVLTWIGMVVMAILFFMAGASMGSLNVLQSVMIADCVDYEEYTNGIRPDGVFFSGQSFITKLSAGIASLISGAVYAIVKFSDKNVALLNNALVNGADFKTYNDGKFASAMFFLISIPPAIGMALAAIPTWKYALTDKEHTRILDELNAKRNSAESDDVMTEPAN